MTISNKIKKRISNINKIIDSQIKALSTELTSSDYIDINNDIQQLRGRIKLLEWVLKQNSNTNRYDTNKFTPPFRVGRKSNNSVLDNNGNLVVIFEESEEQAQLYCDYLNEI